MDLMRGQIYSEHEYSYDHCEGPSEGVRSGSCEMDHLIPFEVGDSNDIENV